MADELIENAEFGRKNKNEEDPILVAQRFLNIYRQMHIFNKERQNQFDDMLLELQPDVRILLSTLPGGSLLIEHIEELEQKRGLVSVPVKKENSFRKKASKDLASSDASSEKSGKAAVGSVVIDSSFATELSSSLSLALQQTEKRYKDDIKTLTETITQSIMASQSAIANMMKDILIASRNKNYSNNDNVSIQELSADGVTPAAKHDIAASSAKKQATIQNAKDLQQKDKTPDDQIDTAYKENKTVEDTSVSLNKNAAIKTQSEEVSTESEISLTEKEKKPTAEKSFDKKQKNKEILPDSLSEVSQSIQSENTDNVAEENLQKNDVENSAVQVDENISQFAKEDDAKAADTADLAENASTKTDEKATLNLGKITALANDLAKKIGKNKKNKQQEKDDLSKDAAIISESATENVFDDTSTAPEKTLETNNDTTNFDNISESASENVTKDDKSDGLNTDTAFVNNLESLPNESATIDNEILPVIPTESEAQTLKVSDKEPVEDKNDISKDVSATNDLPLPFENDDSIYKDELSKIREALQFSETDNNTDNNEAKTTPVEKNIETVPSENSKNQPEDFISANALSPDDLISLDDLPDTPISLDDISEETISLDDYEDENPTSAATTSNDDTYANPSDEQDWEWEYVDDNDSNNDSNDDDWEWEYVEDDGSDDGESEDWEWEYVEDDGSPDETDNKNK